MAEAARVEEALTGSRVGVQLGVGVSEAEAARVGEALRLTAGGSTVGLRELLGVGVSEAEAPRDSV